MKWNAELSITNGTAGVDPRAFPELVDSGHLLYLPALGRHCSLTDQVRVWTRKSGCWRSVLFARDGAVPVCYDPANRQLVVNFGKGWIPIPKD